MTRNDETPSPRENPTASDAIAAAFFRYAVERFHSARSHHAEISRLCLEAAVAEPALPERARLESLVAAAGDALGKAEMGVCLSIALMDPGESAGRLGTIGYTWPTRAAVWGGLLFISVEDDDGDGDRPRLKILDMAGVRDAAEL